MLSVPTSLHNHKEICRRWFYSSRAVVNVDIGFDYLLQEYFHVAVQRHTLQSAEDLFCIGQHGDAGLQQMVPAFYK